MAHDRFKGDTGATRDGQRAPALGFALCGARVQAFSFLDVVGVDVQRGEVYFRRRTQRGYQRGFTRAVGPGNHHQVRLAIRHASPRHALVYLQGGFGRWRQASGLHVARDGRYAGRLGDLGQAPEADTMRRQFVIERVVVSLI